MPLHQQQISAGPPRLFTPITALPADPGQQRHRVVWCLSHILLEQPGGVFFLFPSRTAQADFHFNKSVICVSKSLRVCFWHFLLCDFSVCHVCSVVWFPLLFEHVRQQAGLGRTYLPIWDYSPHLLHVHCWFMSCLNIPSVFMFLLIVNLHFIFAILMSTKSMMLKWQ